MQFTLKRYLQSYLGCLLGLIFMSDSSFAALDNINGGVTFEVRKVPKFSKVTLKGVGELIFSDIDQEIIKIEAEKKIIPLIETTVINDELVIQTKGNVRLTKPIKYYLAVEEIDSISVNGSARISNFNILKFDNLSIDAKGASRVDLNQLFGENLYLNIQGSAVVKLKGSINLQVVDVSGAGQYSGVGLISNEAKMTVKGASRSFIYAKEKLSVNGSGASSVKYIGNPVIEKTLIGVGSLEPLTEVNIYKH